MEQKPKGKIMPIPLNMMRMLDSPKYNNLTLDQFEAFIEWFDVIDMARVRAKSSKYYGKWVIDKHGKLWYLTIHQLIAWWYYYIHKTI